MEDQISSRRAFITGGMAAGAACAVVLVERKSMKQSRRLSASEKR
jgi:hypothetical protein